jgi:hypothetical protein
MKEEDGAHRAADDIHALLQAADPLRSESSPSASDVERMRHAVLKAEQCAGSVLMWWPRALAAAAFVVLLVIAGTLGGRDNAHPEQPGDATRVAAPPDPAERRQLQFETPGGTRIIWTIDPNFRLEGVAP